MQDFLELAVSATASGCIYGLVALAYLLMIRPTGIINFAVGEWAMLGAFGGYIAFTKYELPSAVGIPLIFAFLAAIGWVTERIAVRPLVEKGSGLLAPILALLGVLVVTREVISLSFPPDPLPVPFPVDIENYKYFVIGVTAAVFAAFWFFFEKTLWGKSF